MNGVVNTQPSRSEDTLMTTYEAAGYLRVSPRTMEDWRRAGTGPLYISIARNCVRYRYGDLTQWIIRRRVRHTLAALS